jgi:hypothetical protein
MTDWLPWGGAMMAGIFTTTALALRELERTPVGEKPRLRGAHWALFATIVVTLTMYLLYVFLGESWIWYLR